MELNAGRLILSEVRRRDASMHALQSRSVVQYWRFRKQTHVGRMFQRKEIVYVVPIVSVLLGLLFLYKSNGGRGLKTSSFPLQREVHPLKETLNITFNVQRKIIEGTAVMDLEVEGSLSEVRVSAADMIWDMFSARLTDAADRAIPIKDYHVDESEGRRME